MIRLPLLAATITSAFVSAALAAAAPVPRKLLAEARVSQDAARRTALAQVPGGTIASAELERENGKLVWSFDITRPTTKNVSEVQVDAISGAIAAIAVETPEDQAREAAADRTHPSRRTREPGPRTTGPDRF